MLVIYKNQQEQQPRVVDLIGIPCVFDTIGRIHLARALLQNFTMSIVGIITSILPKKAETEIWVVRMRGTPSAHDGTERFLGFPDEIKQFGSCNRRFPAESAQCYNRGAGGLFTVLLLALCFSATSAVDSNTNLIILRLFLYFFRFFVLTNRSSIFSEKRSLAGRIKAFCFGKKKIE
ncbi:hypothetical protein SLEP1_g35280 [Rubroshorea leprosula]|uniref:Uncharacterized protein n=1 Tax=Rubroshorea leprosula TaxID=152421 RepID=A0AAV5KN71_9ROSI|nr:hypothetical protein SLEP1_g35280 [Rubroshorea leprosula]